MERALAVLAALGLAACSVNVEGAPCTTPGRTEDCPAGRACGNDRKCSERAAACAGDGTRCTLEARKCGGAGGTASVERCSGDADPVCGTWIVARSCAADDLVCGSRSGGPDCECRSGFAGPEFAADPGDGSLPGAFPFPTGAASPTQCRLRRIGDAIAAAAQVQASGAVKAYGNGTEVVFGDATSGDGPIAIPANVTVVAASAPATATILRIGAATSAPLVTLGGRLEGFRIESTVATGAGVAVSCGASGKPSLASVVVDGGGKLTTGIDVSGACGADLNGVSVSNVVADPNVAGSGAALHVHADPAAEVTISGGKLGASDVGASLTGGKLTLGVAGDPAAAVEIAGNAKDGVAASGGSFLDARLYFANVHGNGGAALSVADASTVVAVFGGTLGASDVGARLTGGTVTFGSEGDALGSVNITGNTAEGVHAAGGAAVQGQLHLAKVHGNGGTGVFIEGLSTGSAVTVRRSDIYSNGTVAPRKYGPTQRPVGGVFVSQGALAFTFSGNLLYANAGDQLAFESANTAWKIGPVACGDDSNSFGCYPQGVRPDVPPPGCAAGSCAVAIAGGGAVDARNTVWPFVPIAPYASAGVTGSYCNGDPAVPPALPTCP